VRFGIVRCCGELRGVDPERGTELGEVLLNLRPTQDKKLTTRKIVSHLGRRGSGKS
jgi:hypothetical protein